MVKYYHTSPYRLQVGTILTGQRISFETGIPSVWMTNSPVPHYTIFEDASKNSWHVYEVKPMDKVIIGKMWDEYMTSHCQIVKYIGNSKGICKGHKGSGVFPKEQHNYNLTKFSYSHLREMIKKLEDLYPEDTKVEKEINKVQFALKKLEKSVELLKKKKNLPYENPIYYNINWARDIVSKEDWNKFEVVLKEFVDFYSKKI